MDNKLDFRVRLAAFEWLSEQVKIYGDVLPRGLLQQGFEFSGKRVHLVAHQGIFTPKILGIPLSITTAPSNAYKDVITKEDVILYKYLGKDPQHSHNIGLRKAMEKRFPLIYFHGVVAGKYLAIWPVYIIADNPGKQEFTVVADEAETVGENAIHDDGQSRQMYITRKTRIRLRQHIFREKVLKAYREQCALCKLRHKELLDAAHIIPAAEKGNITVNNGISLCKLHHAAFDNFLIGITPDFQVEVKKDILMERDGPMLQYGLKDLHRSSIILPARKVAWPDQDFLSQRYKDFTNRI